MICPSKFNIGDLVRVTVFFGDPRCGIVIDVDDRVDDLAGYYVLLTNESKAFYYDLHRVYSITEKA